MIDIIRQKAIKRKLSLKIFDFNPIETTSGNKIKQTINLKKELIKKLQKKSVKILEMNLKKVNVSINGETLRVTSKSKNDLQLTIKLLNNLEEIYKIPLQANNYR